MLLGVNSDGDRDELKKTIERENLTWRSWWDNGSTEGPIQTEWQVDQRPMIYLLDAKGIVRHKSVAEDELKEAIDHLLKELADKSSIGAHGARRGRFHDHDVPVRRTRAAPPGTGHRPRREAEVDGRAERRVSRG